MPTLTIQERVTKAQSVWETYPDHPAKFIEDQYLIGWSQLDPWQRRLCNEIAIPNAQVAVRSGNGTGKTFIIAAIAEWFLSCVGSPVNFAKVIATSGKEKQLWDNLMSEAERLLGLSKENLSKGLIDVAIGDFLTWSQTRITVNGFAAKWYIVARTAKFPENLHGFHAPHLLFLSDESSIIEDVINEAIEGAMTGFDARRLAIGNPMKVTGWFRDCWGKHAKAWKTIHVKPEDSAWQTQKYRDGMNLKYGVDSPIYKVRVLGEFPDGDDDSWIPLSIIEAAMTNENTEFDENEYPMRAGLDVARYGKNQTVLVLGKGNKLLHCFRWGKKNAVETINRVMMFVREHGIREICIDEDGIGGPMLDVFRENVDEADLPWDLDLYGVMSGEASTDEHFENHRAQMWGSFKRDLEEEVLDFSCLAGTPDEQILCGEASTVKWKPSKRGLILMESKEDMMGRNVDSPDTADAVVYWKYGRDYGRGEDFMSAGGERKARR